MALVKENKVEYERVDEKGDKYRRILVKFNPRSLRESDFEIEFIPILVSVDIGGVFVSEIDSMSTIDLYRWAGRHMCLTEGGGGWKRGTIIPKKANLNGADTAKRAWRSGEEDLDPRLIISCVKSVFVSVAEEFDKQTAYAYNHFLKSGQLGSLPLVSKEFNVEELRKIIEEVSYPSKNADGDVVERPLVRHLFGTHKTEYVKNAILNFLEATCLAAWDIMKDRMK